MLPERRKATEAVVFTGIDKKSSPTMIVKDFALMLEDRTGCVGRNGGGSDDDDRVLNSARFEFNDEGCR
ncbi:hypothetical protein O206_19725 [Ochrobactrum sp. EGD-AQ16]|nr:hypothetical protein O206_19725 [Ochrobactrum sp. EGD-AQ16]